MRLEDFDRSNVKRWTNYMESNPIYFEFVSGKAHTPLNIGRLAREVFGDEDKTIGLNNIAEYLGIARPSVYRYKRNHGLPVFLRGRVFVGYNAHLIEWAKRKRVGIFARGV